MNRSPVLLGVAAVLAGTTAILGIFGVVFTPVLLVAAVPFAAAAYVIWRHATGRLAMRARAVPTGASLGRNRAGRRGDPTQRPPRDDRSPPADSGPPPARVAAATVLDVPPDADEATVRRAFRAKAREHHPDTPGGDAEQFRRIRDAYDRLMVDR